MSCNNHPARGWPRAIAMACAFFSMTSVFAYDQTVEKKTFTLPSYTTVGGKVIKNVRVGYESYGTLNAAGDNAIFVAHFYSGNSHAAGKYKPGDAAPGYWDAIIGAGKALDTDKYFIVSADTLTNLNTKDPNTTTTGPASINPDTAKPYGMSFPVVTLRDSVNVHKALVDSLGVKKLQAVAGRSGGSMQAFEWAAAYPEFVERVVAATSPGLDISPYGIATLNVWSLPIRLDPKWKNGDYYGGEEPVQGVAQALKIVTLSTRSADWADANFGAKWAAADKNPIAAVDTLFAIEEGLDKAGMARAKLTDANSMLYTSKALQIYDLNKDAARIKAKVLLVPVKSDLLFPPEMSRRTAEKLRAQGNYAEVFEIDANGGHSDPAAIAKANDAIRAFMAK